MLGRRQQVAAVEVEQRTKSENATSKLKAVERFAQKARKEEGEFREGEFAARLHFLGCWRFNVGRCGRRG